MERLQLTKCIHVALYRQREIISAISLQRFGCQSATSMVSINLITQIEYN